MQLTTKKVRKNGFHIVLKIRSIGLSYSVKDANSKVYNVNDTLKHFYDYSIQKFAIINQKN